VRIKQYPHCCFFGGKKVAAYPSRKSIRVTVTQGLLIKSSLIQCTEELVDAVVSSGPVAHISESVKFTLAVIKVQAEVIFGHISFYSFGGGRRQAQATTQGQAPVSTKVFILFDHQVDDSRVTGSIITRRRVGDDLDLFDLITGHVFEQVGLLFLGHVGGFSV